ncbi:MAG TPA: hypothetical protein VH988_15090 [Thermoanaerobaculia bacterium]|nr:hypothetical protein [Thermoanaerobaculia bacterium]
MRTFKRTLMSLSLLAGCVVAAPLAAAPLSPLGPDFRLDMAGQNGGRSVVAIDPSGNALEMWTTFSYELSAVFARSYDRTGRTSGLDSRLDQTAILKQDATLAAVAPGRFAAAWLNYDDYDQQPVHPVDPALGTISARFLDAQGRPVSGEIRVNVTNLAEPGSLWLTALPGGGFAALWREGDETSGAATYVRAFDAAGQPLAAPFAVATAPSLCRIETAGLGSLADGTLLAFWNLSTLGGDCGLGVHGQHLTADGRPQGAEIFLGPVDDVAVRRDGTFVAVRTVSGATPLVDGFDVHAQLYDVTGRALGNEITVAGGAGNQSQAVVAADAAGRFLVLWEERASVVDPTSPALLSMRFFDAAGKPLGAASPATSARTGTQGGARLSTNGAGDWALSWRGLTPLGTYPFARRFATCSDSQLCLNGGRFQVAVSWRDVRTGESGSGNPVPLTDDTGSFWLFSPDNLEMMVKVLDGGAVNGHFWVFYGALTDVEYDLKVTDAETGLSQTYHNDAGHLVSRGDTGAFQVTAATTESPADGGRSFAAATSPLLLNDRFDVAVSWRDPRTGQSGAGTAVPLTHDTGAFWFFGDQNLEMMVKVLDGRALNGHFWVFFAALSDTAITLRVTDRETGAVRTYTKLANRLASRADVTAF